MYERTLTHLLLDSTVEGKGNIRSMQYHLHQGRPRSFVLWTSVDDLVEDAGRIASTGDLLVNFILGFPQAFQETLVIDL